LPVSKQCTHIKGHGGLKAIVRDVHRQLHRYTFVLRTDVKAYYASISHYLLMEKLAVYIKDRNIMNLLWQYMHRCVERGGLYQQIQKGISRDCPLRPLMGAFYLTCLDEQFKARDVYYVRYMDDILILTSTRWKLRKAIKTLNQTLSEHQLEKHPDKTFIGRIAKGFDFLGYQFSPAGLTVATKTIEHFVVRWHRLYEQKKTHPHRDAFLDDYVRRWWRWVYAALQDLLAPNFLFALMADTHSDQANTQ
jgi:hypothetical protein